jgi:hypothetical protein
MSDRRTVTVEFDQSMHPSINYDELSEADKLAFSVLDTAYKLLREYAVRVTLAGVRDAVGEVGQTLPSDEEMFRLARESDDPEAPKGYLDLAPDEDLAAMGVHAAFTVLVDAAADEATEAFSGE